VNEDPSFLPDEEEKAVGEQIAEAAKTGLIPGSLSLDDALLQYAKAFAGMTVEGYRQYVREFCTRPVVGFEGMTFKEAFYKPMVNVVDYLNANGFTVYICSGSDRSFCREITDGVLAIADNHVIGLDVMLKARGQGNTEGLKYVYMSDDAVVRTDEVLMQNTKMNKVSQLAQELGHPPVLCFGNSSGDESMAVYTTSNNPYYSKAFMLIADDSERDYGDEKKAEESAEKWREHNWVVISMKNDFKTIYGDNVIKTSK
jgi:phosphoserine phosphatase